MKNKNEENIDERIERVLRSVAAKKEDMTIWSTEKTKRELRYRRIRNFGVSAAASVAVLVGVGSWYMIFYWKEAGQTSDLSPSPMSYEYSPKQYSSNYKGDSSDIESVESLIESERYEDALDAIEAILVDTLIDPTLSLERKREIMVFQEDKAYALEWIKIQALIKLNRKADALDLLNHYVEISGSNQNKAKELIDELNNY